MVKPRYRIFWYGQRPHYLELLSRGNELYVAKINGDEVGLIVRVA